MLFGLFVYVNTTLGAYLCLVAVVQTTKSICIYWPLFYGHHRISLTSIACYRESKLVCILEGDPQQGGGSVLQIGTAVKCRLSMDALPI